MLKLLEKGMSLNRNKKWYVRVIGKLLMVPPILKAKWVEARVNRHSN